MRKLNVRQVGYLQEFLNFVFPVFLKQICPEVGASPYDRGGTSVSER